MISYKFWRVLNGYDMGPCIPQFHAVGQSVASTAFRWGMTPMHMTGLGQHPYGAAVGIVVMLCQFNPRDISNLLIYWNNLTLCFDTLDFGFHDHPHDLEWMSFGHFVKIWVARPITMCFMGAHPIRSCRSRGSGNRENPHFSAQNFSWWRWQALNSADQSPWHIAQRMQKPSHLKKWEKVGWTGERYSM